MNKAIEAPEFTKLINLAAEKLGGKTLACSDDFFAEMENLLKPGRGVFIEGKYTENGKWMDGWESRRKRTPGHDWCIVKLATTGTIKGFDVDTNHFLGNHPPHCSIEACLSTNDQLDDSAWTEILHKSALDPGSQHYFEIDDDRKWSHLRLNIFPDGGVARLKVYGEVHKDWNAIDGNEVVDLASARNGAKSILCNDMFFSHMDNLLMPGKGVDMGDGWETKRNRTPNNRDWVIVRLATKGTIQNLMVDTHHFKGNYPDSCMIEGCVASSDENIADNDWTTILPQSKLQAHAEHTFENELESNGPFTHIRLNIFPDGGISRLRIWGNITQ
jgi:allantoicase